MSSLNQNDILENDDSNYKLRRLKEVKKRQKLQKKEQKLDKENYIKLFVKQNKYLKNMDYAKVLPISLFHPNIDFINIGSSMMYIKPTSRTQMDLLRYKLNNIFFEGVKSVNIFNLNSVNSKIEMLNRRPSNNYGFKFKYINNKIYAIRETFHKYIINEKDFIQVLNQFDNMYDGDTQNGELLFKNQYNTATDSAKYTIPVSKQKFVTDFGYFNYENRYDFDPKTKEKSSHVTKLLKKISSRLRNSGKLNRYIMEISTHKPINDNIYDLSQNKYSFNPNDKVSRLELIDISNCKPMYFKYRDNTILGLTKNQNSDYYNIDTKKTESNMEYTDIASYLTFLYLTIYQFTTYNKKFIGENIDTSLLLSYKDIEQEKYYDDIYFMIYFINNIQTKINNYIKQYYMNNNLNINIRLNRKNKKYISINQNNFKHQKLLKNDIENINDRTIEDVICYNNKTNFGIIIQLLPSDYEEKYTKLDYESRVHKRLNEFTKKEISNNFSIFLEHEYLQVSKTQYCAVYFDNNRRKAYYFSPNINNSKELIQKRLVGHNLLNEFNEQDKISNNYNYLGFGLETLLVGSKEDRILNYKLYDDVKEENKFKDSKINNSLFFEKINNSELSLEDMSGLYCLYFLIAMSTNMTNNDDVPISSLEDPFTDYFDDFFKYYKHESFKPTSERESIEERRKEYLNHVKFICDYIGDMLFTGLNETYGNFYKEIENYKKNKMELKDILLEKTDL